MPFRGSIVAITLSSTGTKAGGTATFQVRKNGAAISNALLTWPNAARASVRFVKGTLGFVRDDRLDVTFTTSSGYTPTTSIVEVIIWATQDSEETV